MVYGEMSQYMYLICNDHRSIMNISVISSFLELLNALILVCSNYIIVTPESASLLFLTGMPKSKMNVTF